jgi:hypothetical protein
VHVSDVPARAEVLLRRGQAPLQLDAMPVGTRLEFVATAEGYVPARVVVAPGATWSPAASGTPTLDVAAHLEKSTAKGGDEPPWPAADPGSAVGGQGPAGTLRLSSAPAGAEIWMLAGMGPEVTIDRLACEQDYDVLVAGPGTARKRIHVAASDLAPAPADPGAPPGGRVLARIARVSAK